MKKLRLIAVLAVALAVAGVAAGTAKAWHATSVDWTVACNTQSYTYVVSTPVITQSSQWPGATVKSVTPASFPGTTTGSVKVTVVIKWSNGETQTWEKYHVLDGKCVPPPEVFCPADTVQIGSNPLVCLKTVKETVTVNVPVPGPPVPVPGPPVPGPPVPVPGPERVVVKTKTVTAKQKPCVMPTAVRKAGNATMTRGKDGNCYITITKVKHGPPKIVHDRCVPPPDEPGCEGKCDWPKKFGGNG